MTDPNIFNTVLVWPLLNVLVASYNALTYLHVPYALGFSIIVLTAIIRLVLYPFMASQLKVSHKMQKLAPHVSKLKEKHKNDAKRLQVETMALYKEHGVNPAAGCLPALVQLPIIWGLYTVLQHVVDPKVSPLQISEQVNKIVYHPSLRLSSPWDPYFFGIPLGKSPSDLLSTLAIIAILVPLITAALQFIQSKMMMTKPVEEKALVKKGQKTEAKKPEDFATAFQTQSLYIFPVMIGFFSYTLPVGLSLYWNTFTLFGILQQYRIQGGWGGLVELKPQLKNIWQKTIQR